MTPSVIVFDLGKVLVDFDFSIAARRVAARARLPVDPVHFFSDQAPLVFRYEVGLINTPQFFDEICRVSGFDGTAEEFGGFFADIFTPMQPMIELHAALRQLGFPTYIFSNTNELAIQSIRQHYPFFAHFNGYVLSYEHGSMKPDAKLYEAVERETKRSGKDIVYIDDRPENIEAGAARGWQTILQVTPEKTWSAIRGLRLLDGRSGIGGGKSC